MAGFDCPSWNHQDGGCSETKYKQKRGNMLPAPSQSQLWILPSVKITDQLFGSFKKKRTLLFFLTSKYLSDSLSCHVPVAPSSHKKWGHPLLSVRNTVAAHASTSSSIGHAQDDAPRDHAFLPTRTLVRRFVDTTPDKSNSDCQIAQTCRPSCCVPTWSPAALREISVQQHYPIHYSF